MAARIKTESSVHLRKVTPGEPITADQWNLMVDRVNRTITGGGVKETPNGWQFPPPKQEGTAEGVTKQVIIVAFGTGRTTFLCKDIDNYGNATGDAFAVHVRCYGDTPGNNIDGTDLADATPNRAVGDYIEVSWRKLWNRLVGWVEGWFAVEPFDKRGC